MIYSAGVSGGGIGGTIVNAKGATALERLGLRAAKALDRIGVPARVNHALTGWFQWPTTKEWLTEFSDKEARIKPRITETSDIMNMPLHEALDHPKLYERLPDMRDIPTRLIPGGGKKGYYQPPLNVEERIQMQEADDIGWLRSALLHEGAGHAVQRRLGLSGGGSPDFVERSATRAMDQLQGKQALAADALQYHARLAKGFHPDQAEMELLPGAADFARAHTPEEIAAKLEPVADAMRGWRDLSLNPRGGYMHLGGEAQARLIEARSNLGPVGLRVRYPLDDLDVDPNKLLELNTPGVRPGLSAAVKGWIK